MNRVLDIIPFSPDRLVFAWSASILHMKCFAPLRNPVWISENDNSQIVCLVWASCTACLLSQAVPELRVVAPAVRPVFCDHLLSACRSLRTWDTMPTMAMQNLNLGGMTRTQIAAAYRSRCAVRTMAVVAAPPKTGLKTEVSEKVRLFCGIA